MIPGAKECRESLRSLTEIFIPGHIRHPDTGPGLSLTGLIKSDTDYTEAGVKMAKDGQSML